MSATRRALSALPRAQRQPERAIWRRVRRPSLGTVAGRSCIRLC